MAEKKTKKEKVMKTTKNGERKERPTGAAWFAAFADRIAVGMTSASKRAGRWAEKASKSGNDSVRDNLTSINVLFTGIVDSLTKIHGLSENVVAANWAPPAVAVTSMKFSEGDTVSIKAEYHDFYASNFKGKNLSALKVGGVIPNGKRTSYLIPEIGFVPKGHLERVSP